MAKKLNPGQNSGIDGGIYVEKTPGGKSTGNYKTIADDKTAPPTSKPGYHWEQEVRTPDSKGRR